MKAILIDPVRRDVRGIEVESTEISSALDVLNGKQRKLKVLLLSVMIGWDHVLFYDGYAPQNQSSAGFWMQGVGQYIVGRGLLLDRQGGQWPIATTLTVREVEQLVRFQL